MQIFQLSFVSSIVFFSALSFAESASSPTSSMPVPICPGENQGPSSSAAEIVEKVQKNYDKIQTFEATFTQKYTLAAYGQTKQSKGKVTFSKPGKMRWDYNEPKGNIVVSDGTTLWSHIDGQTRSMPMKESQMPAILSFLMGKGNLSKEFDFTLLDSKSSAFKNFYLLKATPKVATNLYSTVVFYVDGCVYQVRRVLIADAQDNRNRFDFDSPVVNLKYEDSKFKWSGPPAIASN